MKTCVYIYHLGNIVFTVLIIMAIAGVLNREEVLPYALIAFLFGAGGTFFFLATYVYVLFIWTFTDYKSEKYIGSDFIRLIFLNIIVALFLAMTNLKADDWIVAFIIVDLAFLCHLQMAKV